MQVVGPAEADGAHEIPGRALVGIAVADHRQQCPQPGEFGGLVARPQVVRAERVSGLERGPLTAGRQVPGEAGELGHHQQLADRRGRGREVVGVLALINY